MCIFLVACNESLCSFWASWTSCNTQCLSFGSRVCNQGGACAESMTVQCTGGSCSTGKLSVINVDLHIYNIAYTYSSTWSTGCPFSVPNLETLCTLAWIGLGPQTPELRSHSLYAIPSIVTELLRLPCLVFTNKCDN